MNPRTEIDILKLEKALAELDADWFQRQDSFKLYSRYEAFIPKEDNADVQLGFWIFGCMVLICTYLMSMVGNFGLLNGIILLTIWGLDIRNIRKKAKYYQEQKAIYDTQREHLLLEIQKLKSLV